MRSKTVNRIMSSIPEEINKKVDDYVDSILKSTSSILICNLVECPNCHNDIWVEVGYHCGFDAVLDGISSTDCYKCSTTITFDFSDISIQKDVKFMTVSELVDIQTKTK